MEFQDDFGEDEPAYAPDAEPWRLPARCPHCLGNQTRFISLSYEMSVYECDVCGIQFEAEE